MGATKYHLLTPARGTINQNSNLFSLPSAQPQDSGTYFLTVTEDGCTSQQVSAVVNVAPACDLSLTLQPLLPTCSNAQTGIVEVFYSGGIGNVFYSTDNVAFTQAPPNEFIISNLGSTVTVDSKDSSSPPCLAHASISLGVSQAPTITISGDLDICGENPPALTAVVNPSTGNYSYAWSKNNQPFGANSQTIQPDGSGSYAVTVTDLTTGCQGSSMSVSINTNLSAAISPAQPCLANGSVTLQALPNPQGIYTYTWTFMDNPSILSQVDTINVTKPGVYTETITDTTTPACTSSHSVLVTAPPSLSITPNGTIFVCTGESVV